MIHGGGGETLLAGAGQFCLRPVSFIEILSHLISNKFWRKYFV